jgi:hypothetical protein
MLPALGTLAMDVSNFVLSLTAAPFDRKGCYSYKRKNKQNHWFLLSIFVVIEPLLQRQENPSHTIPR